MSNSLVVGFNNCFCSGLRVRRHHLRRAEFEGQLVDLAGEGKRNLVVRVVHSGSGVHANIEGLVRHFQERDRVWLLLCDDFFAVHLQHTGAALGNTRVSINADGFGAA